MKPWQLIAGFCASLVIIGLLLCDDIRTHSTLRDCEKAVGLKPDTAVNVIPHPRDSQIPQGVGIHPATPQIPQIKPSPAKPPETALKPLPDSQGAAALVKKDTGLAGTAGSDTTKIDTFCIEDTTVFPDSEKIYHQLCSPDIRPTSRITGLWTFRERPPDSQKTISKPIIMYRTPLAARWYIQLPLGTIIAVLGYEVGKHSKQ
jgi:hypothetical protein